MPRDINYRCVITSLLQSPIHVQIVLQTLLINNSNNRPRKRAIWAAKMSQEQPKRPQAAEQEPVKYGDVFQVSGELASKPIAPEDAAMMQAAETTVLGQVQKGGPAAVMQAAAFRNEMAGIVRHRDVTDMAGEARVTVTETDHPPGTRIITESVAGHVS